MQGFRKLNFGQTSPNKYKLEMSQKRSEIEQDKKGNQIANNLLTK